MVVFRLILMVLLLPVLTDAATYTATPATFKALVARLQPGDTLLLTSGHYGDLHEGRMRLPSGTAQARITIAAAPGAQVTLGRVEILRARYLTLRGVRIQRGVQLGAPLPQGGTPDLFARFEDVEITSATTAGNVVMVYANHNTFVRVRAHESTQIRTNIDHCYYIQGHSNRIEGGEVTGCSGYGVHIYNGYDASAAHHNVVTGVHIHHNGLEGARKSGGGLLLSKGAGNVASHNRIHDNRGVGLQVNYGAEGACVQGNTVQGGIYIGPGAARTILGTNQGPVRDEGGSTTMQGDKESPCPMSGTGGVPPERSTDPPAVVRPRPIALPAMRTPP